MLVEPHWHKPRAALSANMAFGLWVVCGAWTTAEPQMVLFGLFPVGMGLAIYGLDCLVHRLANGRIRPDDVLRSDIRSAAVSGGLGTALGLAAPLYMG